MKKFFLVKIKHAVKHESGKVDWVTEDYLVEAMNYSDAEIQAFEYAEQYWAGTFRIMSVTRQSITGAFGLREGEEGEVYKLKFEYESETDARLNKIKKFSEHYYVVATDLTESIRILQEELGSVNFLGQAVVEAKRLNIVDFICEEEDLEEVDPMMEAIAEHSPGGTRKVVLEDIGLNAIPDDYEEE